MYNSMVLWSDDDKTKINTIMTQIYHKFWKDDGHDINTMLRGNIVIFGESDDNGKFTSISKEMKKVLQRYSSVPILTVDGWPIVDNDFDPNSELLFGYKTVL